MTSKRTEAFFVIGDLICAVLNGALISFVPAISQWADSGEWPSKIVWCSIIGATILGGTNGWKSYTSGKFTRWMDERKSISDERQQSN